MRQSKLKFTLFVSLVLLAFFIVNEYAVFSQDNIERWQDEIASLGMLAPIGFILLYVLGTVVFLPGTIFTLIGGAVFGVFWGSILGVLAATLGAICAHWTARLFGKEFIDSLLENYFPRIDTYNKKIADNGFMTVLILRLTPFIPYNILNLTLAYSPVNTKDYAWATAIGITPGIIAYVYLGEALATLSLTNIIVGTLGIVLYMLITAIIVKYVRTKKQAPAKQPTES